jgi:hypothetical protein
VPNYRPSSQGWTESLQPTVTLANNTTDSALQFTDPAVGNNGEVSIAIPAFSYSTNWILTARVRVDSGQLGEWYFGVQMGGNFWNVQLANDTGDANLSGAYTFGSPPPYPQLSTNTDIGTAFHTFQLRGVGPSAAPELWVDGSPTGQFARDGFGGAASRVYFGNWGSTPTGVSKWQLVQFEGIPEPSSLLLLSLSGLALALRRRR